MTALFLSCEHGGNEVPKDLLPCFAGHEDVLETHRALDLGALDLFHRLAPLAAETTYATLSRLCIELNRSEAHPRLFSEFTRQLGAAQKQRLLDLHHRYRNDFIERTRERIAARTEVMHVAVHSFTPVLNGVKRTMDIGLLYDPARANERNFCLSWRRVLKHRMPSLTVRMNQPYKGISDGLPTTMRHLFPRHYGGIELEVNQRFAHNGRMDREVARTLFATLAEVLRTMD
ncbi:MAG: N-formylglutamate amidohydrolase [Flavobacteriales bacterium]|jgi:predicted N-formylglutamate amidohydrolase|nr:N-formylglutamate amidohydrolase [Flavobacteriales bacterium]